MKSMVTALRKLGQFKTRSVAKGIDHTVINIEKKSTLNFWRKLGLEVKTFGPNNNRYAIQIRDQKLNVHLKDQQILPRAKNFGTYGSADLCFEVRNLQVVKDLLEKNKIVLEDGPVRRTGARSTFTSLYVRDPEGNLIEFSEYPFKQKVIDTISNNYRSFFIGVFFGATAVFFSSKNKIDSEQSASNRNILTKS